MHDDRQERILELLVVHLGVHIDTGKPTAVSRMGVVPPDSVLQFPCLKYESMRRRADFSKAKDKLKGKGTAHTF